MRGLRHVAVFLLAVLLAGCAASSAGSSAPSSSSPSSRPLSSSITAPLGKRTKTRDCVARLPLPDPDCTPGAAFPDVTVSELCTPGYSRSVRRVSSSTRRRAFLEYGIRSHRRGTYEVDHLVSLEVGGSNSIANLWPEPASPTPGFQQKDEVENWLHEQICNGKIALATAQREEAHNWIALLRKLHRSG